MASTKEHWTNEKLINGIKAGGARRESAWKQFYVQYRDPLRGYLAKETGKPDELEFLLGEVFERLDGRISQPGFSLESATLLTYVWRAIRNHMYHDRRRGRLDMVDMESKPDVVTYNNPEKAQIVNEVLQKVESFGEPCRTILKMAGMGYKHEEIAEAEGIALQTAKNKLSECRKRLINLIGGKDLYDV